MILRKLLCVQDPSAQLACFLDRKVVKGLGIPEDDVDFYGKYKVCKEFASR